MCGRAVRNPGMLNACGSHSQEVPVVRHQHRAVAEGVFELFVVRCTN